MFPKIIKSCSVRISYSNIFRSFHGRLYYISLNRFAERKQSKRVENTNEKIDYKTALEDESVRLTEPIKATSNQTDHHVDREANERMNETGNKEAEGDINKKDEKLNANKEARNIEGEGEGIGDIEVGKTGKNTKYPTKGGIRKSLEDLKRFGGKEILETTSIRDIWDQVIEAIANEKEPDFKKLHDEFYKEVKSSLDDMDKYAHKLKQFAVNQKKIADEEMKRHLKELGITTDQWEKAVELEKKRDKDFSDAYDAWNISIVQWIYPEEQVDPSTKQKIKDYYNQRLNELNQQAKTKTQGEGGFDLDNNKFTRERVVNECVEKFSINPKTIHMIINEKDKKDNEKNNNQ